ncbi:MAG: hypothetical protein IMZ66_12030 [Planctomycetes bacterium]|nr:hypothetical protein [Planctomycetota bacterium]
MGKGWRGQTVRVNGIRVRLTDWMRADKLIDLNPGAFRAVCGSLSVGVCKVRVSW